MSENTTNQDDGSEANIPGQAASGDSNQLSSEDTLEDRGVDDLLDEGYSPPERPSVMTREGYTEDDERNGETLDHRLETEEPDFDELAADEDQRAFTDGDYVGGEVGTERAGRLTDHSGLGGETEDDVLAEDVGIDGGAAGAEEAAMHVIDEE
ncbi:DUF5709 domain-containing protein [Saxibacter everestensis]|uniref:DUF5709 domain-containing protein n=1 Tax=Saxibacter everestensis TaxID=2909229 RepID=A0ABY8QSB9_9MICO|nr:DUF5709 domain-containing protein [Brevibacteriaceae bacterium ZFBP1038]